MPISDQAIEIAIRDGCKTLESRRCRILALAEGRSVALWRGLLYPLLDGNQIDIAGEAFPPSECVPESAASPNGPSFASIEGEDEVYLLLSGSVAERETAATSLRAAGVCVLRTGRYLGDPIDGLAANWFVRFERPHSVEPLDSLLARLLGRDRARQETPAETASEIRLRLVQAELVRARTREASLRSDLTKANAALAQRAASTSEGDSLRDEIASEQRLRYQAEAAHAAAESALATLRTELEAADAEPTLRQPAPRTRLNDEISVVLETLLPNLNLVRDSVTVVAAEYASRKSLYRALGELAMAEGRLPPNWKAVQGATQWWERHVSDGQDNTGRLYAQWVTGQRRWDVLISDKAEQSRDMAWLKRRSPA
ncbi:MAG TPA: hypothetical protein VK741_21560 [Acetobacteraceae bacterium]|jgi:hypothetical protein|nr:hypothetical protein [Acetobacteraceae bacterium]